MLLLRTKVEDASLGCVGEDMKMGIPMRSSSLVGAQLVRHDM